MEGFLEWPGDRVKAIAKFLPHWRQKKTIWRQGDKPQPVGVKPDECEWNERRREVRDKLLLCASGFFTETEAKITKLIVDSRYFA